MRFTMTHYIATNHSTLAGHLDDAIDHALDSAAAQLDTERASTATATIDRGIRIDSGVDALAGSELEINDFDGLTEVTVRVPWSTEDSGTPKLWAAVRFAGVLADELAVAA